MKIQKGKVSTFNAAVIGVLLVVFYLVMPGGSVKNPTSQADPSATDSTANTLPAAKTTTNAVSGTAATENITATDINPVNNELPAIKAIVDISDEDLTLLKEQNPFFTKVIIAGTEDSHEAGNVLAETAPASVTPDLAEELVSISKVSLIYESTTGQRAAVLNSKVVYPGTVIEGDITVESISQKGVQLSSVP